MISCTKLHRQGNFNAASFVDKLQRALPALGAHDGRDSSLLPPAVALARNFAPHPVAVHTPFFSHHGGRAAPLAQSTWVRLFLWTILILTVAGERGWVE